MTNTTNPRSRRAALLVCGWLLGGLACTEDGGTDEVADEPCVPGQSIACTCDGGAAGAQVCEADGMGYGACSCEGSEGESSGASESVGSESAGTGDTTDTGETTGSGWDGTSVPSWNEHIVPFFYASCGADSNACHAREAYAAAVDSGCRGWLSLEDVPLGAEFYAGDQLGMPTGCPDMPLYERLTTLAPWQCAADSAYVSPGSLDGSYVWQKILGQNLCEVSPGVLSEPMPPAYGGMPLSELDKQMISAWIMAGAPND